MVAAWQWPESRGAQRRYVSSLRLTRTQVTEAKSALGKVVHVCHLKSGLSVDRVTTCGSIGKKTASSHSMDLDLVVYLDSLSPDQLKASLPQVLDAIQDAMDKQYANTRDKDWYRKFGLRYVIEGMEIDILIGAKGVRPRDFLQVSDPEQRSYMSASVSHLAKRFIKQQNYMFHDLVRVAKHWRDSFTWAPQCKPKSYLLEIIMLEAFRQHDFCTIESGKTSYRVYFSSLVQVVLKTFFELVASSGNRGQHYDKGNLPPLFACFTTYYKREDLPLDQPEPIFEFGRKVHGKYKIRRATAIIMDPCNPTNNLWLTLADSSSFVNRARMAAQQMP